MTGESGRYELPKKGERPRHGDDSCLGSILFYLSFFKRYRGQVCWAMFFHAIDIFPFFAMPIFVKIIVDNYIPAANKKSIYMMFGLILAMGLLNVFFHTSFMVNYIRVVKSVSRDLRNMIVHRLQVLSLSYHHKNETGRLYSKIMVDVEKTEQFANMLFVSLFGSFVILVFLSGVLSYVNYRILLTFLAIFPVFYVLFALFQGIVRKNRYSERMARENLSASVSNFLQTSLLARLHGHEDFERKKVDDSSQQVIRTSTEAEANISVFASLNSVLSLYFNFTITAIAAIKVIDGELTLGEMLLFVQYIQQMMNHFLQLVNIYPIFTLFFEAMRSIREILDAPDIEYNHGKRSPPEIRGHVSFEQVTFSYDDGTPSARNITVDIPPGTVVGLAGKSGSGKSTFVNLMLGLYRAQQGLVKIDGIPVDQLDMRTVRRYIGVVSQSPIIFSGTVYDNIAHANRSTAFEKVVEAAKNANAHDFIIKMKEGYDSFTGENGVLLSGGEKQRIALARTFLRDPSILILDEATSALDSESEGLIQDAMRNIVRGKTSLIIAHRLSTIRDADIILFFKDGEIVERGTHDELVAMNGEYAKLVKMQGMESAEKPALLPPEATADGEDALFATDWA
jgi:ATP-binding cassette subfamily B protein